MSRILLYSKVMPPAMGGYVTTGFNVALSLMDHHDVTVICENAEDFNQFLSLQGIFTLNVISANDQDSIAAQSFDCVLYNATYESTFYHCNFITKGIPLISLEHNAVENILEKEFLDRNSSAAAIVFPSEYLLRKVQAKYTLESPFRVIGYPINEQEFRPSKYSGDDRQTILLSTICMIKPVRQIELLIDFVQYASCEKKVCLNIYGESAYGQDSQYLTFLKEKTRRLNLNSSVIFHGGINDSRKIYNALITSEYYIDFSAEETYGQAKIEAIMSGKKMILSDRNNDSNLLPHCYPFYPVDMKTASSMFLKNVDNGVYTDELIALQRSYAIQNFSYQNFCFQIGELINAL